MIVAAVGGCGQAVDSPKNSSATTATGPAAAAEPVAANAPMTVGESAPQALAERRGELQGLIEALEAERVQLQSEKLRIAALVQSHQAEGEAQLAALKARAKTLQGQSAQSQDAFAEQARDQMESALMLDQEYRGQLTAVEQRLDASESRLEALRAELQSLEIPASQGSLDAREVLRAMERVADWQLAHLDPVSSIQIYREETMEPRSWQQAAFYVGLTELAQRSSSPRFRNAVLEHGRRTNWQLGERKYHADDHAIGMSYLWAAANGAGADAIAPLRRRFDEILAAPPRVGLDAAAQTPCWDRWCWCDALFMAPPVWNGLSKATGDPRYANYAHAQFKATTDYLYDREEHLFYRDSRFFEQRDDEGRKLFWSRGNGWVFAGLVRVLSLLPATDPARPMYQALFREMAAKLRTLQKADGYWSPSLLAMQGTPPESSGTGFFVYGFAWGIDVGLLDRATYEPAVQRGWLALTKAVHADGRLGFVQQVSDRPDHVTRDDTQFYGVGAFLLAGSAIVDLSR